MVSLLTFQSPSGNRKDGFDQIFQVVKRDFTEKTARLPVATAKTLRLVEQSLGIVIYKAVLFPAFKRLDVLVSDCLGVRPSFQTSVYPLVCLSVYVCKFCTIFLRYFLFLSTRTIASGKGKGKKINIKACIIDFSLLNSIFNHKAHI